MKNNLHKTILVCFALPLLITIIGCVNVSKLFVSIQNTNDKSYGYSKENPILMGYSSNWRKNSNAVNYFISKLQKEGHPLKFVMHATVEKPKNLKRKTTAVEMINNEGLMTEFLDLFVMTTKGSVKNDTVELFFDVTVDGEVKIPLGLTFSESQINNLYQ